MKNPYEILGVSQNASEDEIKKAYRRLSRTYHPDANINNPNKAAAEEKFKEIQQAYQQIMQERERGTSGQSGYGSYGGSQGSYGSYGNSGGYGNAGGYGSAGGYGGYGNAGGYGGFGGFGGFGGYDGGRSQGSQNASWSEEDVRMQAAENYIRNRAFAEALHVLSEIKDRTARWYYLSAMANSGQGNNITAKEHAQRAAAMEPSNPTYRQLVQRLENGGQWYQSMGEAYGNPFEGGGDWCIKLCALNMFCNCCCGGRMFYCC